MNSWAQDALLVAHSCVVLVDVSVCFHMLRAGSVDRAPEFRRGFSAWRRGGGVGILVFRIADYDARIAGRRRRHMHRHPCSPTANRILETPGCDRPLRDQLAARPRCHPGYEP